MKSSQDLPHNVEHDIPERRSLITYARNFLITIVLVLILLVFIYGIIGYRSPMMYLLFATSILVAIGSFHWLVMIQIQKGLDRAKRSEITLLSREVTFQESEEKFRAFVEESADGLMLTDVKGVVTEWNRAMETITAIKREDALGQYIWDLQYLLTTPEQRTEQRENILQANIKDALQTGSSPIAQRTLEVEIQNKDGQRLFVEQSTFTIKSTDGHWMGSILRDISKRKQAEIYQKESLLQLRALLDNIPDSAWIKDSNGTYIAVNKRTADIFANMPEGLVGKTVFHIFPEEIARKLQAEDLEVMQRRQPQRSEERYITLDNNEIWLETIKSPIVNGLGEVTGIAGISRDITERKKIDRLQASIYRISEAANTAQSLEELYRIIHSAINELMPADNFYIALYLPSADLLYFPYHADGVEPEVEWPPVKPGKGLTSYVYRTGQPLLINPEMFTRLEQSGDIELMGKRPIDWLGVPLNTRHGKIGVMAVQTYRPNERLDEADKEILMFVSTQVAMVIERRKMEEALRTSQANLEDAQRLAHVGSWDWDLLTNEITFSNEFYRLAGLEPGTLNFSTSLDVLVQLIHPEDRQYALAALEKLHENQPYSIDHRILRPDGAEIFVHSQADIIRDEAEQPIRRIGAIQDVTEIKQGEIEREKLIRELSAKNTELDRFTYTVSHDLRSPLVTIRGFLGFMEKDIATGKTERIANDMARIISAADKMQHFLDELLILSRAGRVMNPPEPVSFQGIVAETLEMLRGRIEARGVEVHVAKSLPTILCDRTRITQVVQNLVDNAVKFSGDQPSPKIEIGTEGTDSQGRVVLFVRDNGIGIQPESQEKVFDLFNKLDPHTQGTGIGLTLVKRIVEAHHGQVWLKSPGDGMGTTFYFSCPTPGNDMNISNLEKNS